jgi:DNA polymerase delta subunit 1
VPTSWIFLRGQGAKILSLVSVQCMKDNYAIPLLGGGEKGRKYEGALVLEPETGIYMDDPIVVLDFSSLYPSSMIATNMSHDTLVPPGDQGRILVDTLGLETNDVRFDEVNEHGVKVERVVRFVKTETPGVLPRILQYLLSQRKATRSLIKGCDDPFERGVLDGLQLAYKLTANSLYGQLGASTSPICCVDIAASTTAVGRGMITQLKDFVENDFGGDVVYGDTDSCFMKFPRLCVDAAGSKLTGVAAVKKCIELGERCSAEFQKLIPDPQCAEYEKTFWPFILLSKKRYTGSKYEMDASAPPKHSSMGIVTKRRDNAGIVKDVYGGVLKRILDDKDVQAAARFVQTSLKDLVEGRVGIDRLIISKTLKGNYVNPGSIAHAALAKRMRDRDPGSAPSINDRVPYAFVVTANPKAIQADRVEDPAHIRDNGLTLDYGHYITNQIMEPVKQLFALVVHELPGARMASLIPARAGEEAQAKAQKAREDEVTRLLFKEALDTISRSSQGMQDMRSFFSV